MAETTVPESRNQAWEQEFARLRPLYEQLAEEVRFALCHDLDALEIKTHSVTARAKTLESLREKAVRKEYAHPLEEAEDLAGVRVVTLFLSDIAKVDGIIRRHIDVASEEDTIEGGDVATFGYMSKHYVGTLAAHYSGARYDDVKGLIVEIQLRTIIMDAWASISHYLAYKSNSSVPRELRRQFSALSGLFYVADQQFESLVAASGKVQERASADLSRSESPDAVELSLESLSAYLQGRYPSRASGGRESVAELVEDLRRSGYANLGTVDKVLAQVPNKALDLYEADTFEGDDELYSVGMVRVGLSMVDDRLNRALQVPDEERERRRTFLLEAQEAEEAQGSPIGDD